MGKFYGHFAAAFGTLWLGLLALVISTKTYIDADTEVFAFVGFPIIAFLYACLRWSIGDLRWSISEALRDDEEMQAIPTGIPMAEPFNPEEQTC